MGAERGPDYQVTTYTAGGGRGYGFLKKFILLLT